MTGIITLTTDLGAQDAYVAAMKGVILSINPDAQVIDICHSIEPQDISQAAFLLNTVYGYFPKDTIHVVIVDPGVGSQRRAIILKSSQAFFLAPDNGVLSYVMAHAWPREKSVRYKSSLPLVKLKRLPPGFQAISITKAKFWHHPISSTFHGRDIFAPVAAHRSLGVSLEEFGEAITSVNAFPPPHPYPRTKGKLIGHILHIDHFGNLITDISREDLPSGKLRLEVAGQPIEGLCTSYAEGNQLLALVGSSGYLEVAVKNGSAASLLGAKIGDEVSLKPKD